MSTDSRARRITAILSHASPALSHRGARQKRCRNDLAALRILKSANGFEPVDSQGLQFVQSLPRSHDRRSWKRGIPSCHRMTEHTDLFIATAVLASAYIQGLSGVGFSLIGAPAISYVIPGSGSIGLVNLLALSQNAFMLWRENGRIHWIVVKRLLPGLFLGVVVGLLLSRVMANQWRPLVVATSSLASLVALVVWKPTGRPGSAVIPSLWSGSVNSYAGVGGPPLAAYLVHLGLDQGDYIRTQQFCFALLNIASLPFLGLPSVSMGWLLRAVLIIFIGTILGRWTRRFFSPQRARSISVVVIASVSLAALIRSLIALRA